MASEEEAWAYTTDQEDFDDFFSPEPDLEGALAPVDFYAGRCVCCQHGNRQVTSADQRLARQEEQKEIRNTNTNLTGINKTQAIAIRLVRKWPSMILICCESVAADKQYEFGRNGLRRLRLGAIDASKSILIIALYT